MSSVRQIASQQRVNPITVSKVYQILVGDDSVEKKGLGMYLGEVVREQLLKYERRDFIDSQLLELQYRVKRLGFILKDLLQEVS